MFIDWEYMAGKKRVIIWGTGGGRRERVGKKSVVEKVGKIGAWRRAVKISGWIK